MASHHNQKVINGRQWRRSANQNAASAKKLLRKRSISELSSTNSSFLQQNLNAESQLQPESKLEDKDIEHEVKILRQEVEPVRLGAHFIVDYVNYVYPNLMTLKRKLKDQTLPFINLIPNATEEVRDFEIGRALNVETIQNGHDPLIFINEAVGKNLNSSDKLKQKNSLLKGYNQVLVEKAGPKKEIVQLLAVMKRITTPHKKPKDVVFNSELKIVVYWSDLSILCVDILGNQLSKSTSKIPEQQANIEAAILDFLLRHHYQSFQSGSGIVFDDVLLTKNLPLTRRSSGSSPLKEYLDRLVQIALANDDPNNKPHYHQNRHAWQVDHKLDYQASLDVFNSEGRERSKSYNPKNQNSPRYVICTPPGAELNNNLLYYGINIEQDELKSIPWFSCASCGSSFFCSELQLINHLQLNTHHHCVMLPPENDNNLNNNANEMTVKPTTKTESADSMDFRIETSSEIENQIARLGHDSDRNSSSSNNSGTDNVHQYYSTDSHDDFNNGSHTNFNYIDDNLGNEQNMEIDYDGQLERTEQSYDHQFVSELYQNVIEPELIIVDNYKAETIYQLNESTSQKFTKLNEIEQNATIGLMALSQGGKPIKVKY